MGIFLWGKRFPQNRANPYAHPPNAAACFLLLAVGHAVGALIHGGVAFMGADQNLLQRAVVGGIAMMDALGNSTFNVLVCVGSDELILNFYNLIIVAFSNKVNCFCIMVED